MGLLKILKDKCVKCGICAQVCPSDVLVMDEDGPRALFPHACMACGHCVAVCPHGALDNEKSPLSNQVPLEDSVGPDAKTAEYFLRSRRSTRCYKDQAVSKEEVAKLLDVARFAPSGCNSQSLSYLVIQNPETLKKITQAVINWLEEETKKPNSVFAPFAGMVKYYHQTGKDVILRGAPALILALSPKNFPMGHDNAHFSLAYAELYAPSLGLGTCWAGFVEICLANKYGPILELLNLPEGKEAMGAIMLGYPKYTYHRLVERNPLEVAWA